MAAEYVEPLRVRMAALAEEAPLKLATLKVLHAHYTVLAYLYDLEVKMNLWRWVPFAPESSLTSWNGVRASYVRLLHPSSNGTDH